QPFEGTMIRHYVVLVCCLIRSSAYRLNVPRVLLPYHPSVQVKFDLVVSDPEGGCFIWRSTRPDVVSVKAVEPRKANGCSDRAQIASTSRHADEQTAVIFAEDSVAHVVLSCGVSVDVIRSISISTTTKVLFLDAAPAKVVVQAFNSEGDMFSNLGEIPFEWHLSSLGKGDRPLRIVPFSQSKYEAPDGVCTLEESRKRGYMVLVEGISTGAATLKVSFSEPFFKNVSQREIDLLVMANLVLVPSEDIYLPLGGVVRYSVEIIKQSSREEVMLPSKQYRLSVSDETICVLDVASSLVTAVALGSSEIAIIDENVKAKHIIKPPSAHIYVVSPSALSFTVSGDSWYLEKGRTYLISVQLVDSDENLMLIPDNARFDTTIPVEYFNVMDRSANGTFFQVKALKSGVAALRSTFRSIVDADGEEIQVLSAVTDEVMATISEVVSVSPRLLIFPYIQSAKQHYWQLKADGGTGVYAWSSGDKEIADVDELGVVRAKSVGETSITLRDANNDRHFDTARVLVLRPVKVDFVRSPLEVEIGGDLELSVALFTEWKGEMLRVTDCRYVDFALSFRDSGIFSIVDGYAPKTSLYGNGCSSVMLKALADGNAKVTISVGDLSADTHVSAYPPLKLESPSTVLLSLGSEVEVHVTGGPRPWIADPSGYFSKLSYSDSVDLINHRYDQRRHFISCGTSIGDMLVRIHVGNEVTPSNPMPAAVEEQLRVCCAIPSRVAISIVRENAPAMPPCPANSYFLLKSKSSNISLSAYGRCESGPLSSSDRLFDSISALLVEWSTDEPKLLKVDELPVRESNSSQIFAIAEPQGGLGAIKIVAKSVSYLVGGRVVDLPNKLWASLDTMIVDIGRAIPSEVVLWNEKKTSKHVEIIAGSGHFFAEDDFDQTVARVAIEKRSLEVQPLKVGSTRIQIVDVCFLNRLTVAVTVTDLHEIIVDAPSFVAVGEEISLRLFARDANGTMFAAVDANAMNISLNASSLSVSMEREDPLNYRVLGVACGTVALVASARSASGRDLHSLPHELQVFAPLQLLPKVVTLIPESVFQLEVIGGPQPIPSLSFTLSDSSVASVGENGLISSKSWGITTVVGTVVVQNTSSKASMEVRVVSLRGIRILVSTNRLEHGTLAWARIEGLGEGETPFAFGSAAYPLRVAWRLNTHAVIEIISPFGPAIRESMENQFQVLLRTLEPGQVMLHVSVRVDKQAEAHFKHGYQFDDEVLITVLEPLQLVQPTIRVQSIRVAPNARLELKPNRVDGSVSLHIPPQYVSYISISGDSGAVLRGVSVGDAVLEVCHIGIPHNESTFVTVSVLPVHSVHLDSQTIIPANENRETALSGLPLGYRITLMVSFRDRVGRLFDATSADVQLRPHRFDTTRIVANEDRKSFDVHLKKSGETILMVWDKDNPSINTYLRLPVVDVIRPSMTTLSIGNIVCFKSLLPCGAWREAALRSHFHFVDHHSGIATAIEQGNAIVAAHVETDQSIFTRATIRAVEEIRITEVPPFVSNIPDRRFIFTVSLSSSADAISNAYGCDPSDLKKLDGMRAPFECFVALEDNAAVSASSIFMANAIFVSSSESYACVLQEGYFGSSRALIENDKLNVIVTAIWTGSAKVLEANVRTVFYARFEVRQSELRFDNLHSQRALLTVLAPKSIISTMKIEGCRENVFIIGKPEYTTPCTVQYQIKLNVNSALLWREYLNECNVTVSSELTGQTHSIPAIITLHGDASKAVIRASEGIVNYVTELAEYSMMIVGSTVVTLLCIAVVIARTKGYRILSHLFGENLSAQPNVSGVFISDRSPTTPGYAAWRSMTHHIVRPTRSTNTLVSSRVKPSLSPDTGSVRSSPVRPSADPSDTFLWSTSDSLNTPTALQEQRY
uniref:Nuclear pore membrane glycoprotein 210 n=1 Tax=Parascaris univalens TaxID=6257 RepID=A0A915BWW3_PARUN